jgi:hypothetical protein
MNSAPLADLVLVSRGGPWELERQAEHLAAEGISCRIETDPPGEPIPSRGVFRGGAGYGQQLAIYVAEGDADRAFALIDDFEASRMPHVGTVHEAEESDVCPACQTPYSSAATECAECGLLFAEGWCGDCGSAFTTDHDACPSCGVSLD